MNERVTKILNNSMIVPISVGVVAFSTGIGLGYILGRRNKVEVHTLPDQLKMDFNVDELAEMQEMVKKKTRKNHLFQLKRTRMFFRLIKIYGKACQSIEKLMDVW